MHSALIECQNTVQGANFLTIPLKFRSWDLTKSQACSSAIAVCKGYHVFSTSNVILLKVHAVVLFRCLT